MANGTTHAWTQERTEALSQLWVEGLSGTEIASELGGITRNAVIGKIHRLGLAGRVYVSRKAERVAPRRSKLVRKRKKALPMPKEPPQPCEPLNVSIRDVGAFQCRAITDASEWGNAKCCGHETREGESFCSFHQALYYTRTPVTVR